MPKSLLLEGWMGGREMRLKRAAFTLVLWSGYLA